MNLKEQREKTELESSKAILFKIWGNYFKYENQKFNSFGKSPLTPGSLGTWFKCGEEEVERLREAVLAGNFEVQRKIPGCPRVYQLPSDWMEE